MVNENEIITIKLDDIIPNRFQPREMFDEQSMQELADSIKEHGVIQPIIVRQVDNKYEIIAGERRYKASVMAGKTDIPALVKNKDDKESSIIAFIENSQRKDVSPIEEARTCERILSNNDITQEQLAKQLGMSQSTLANKLRLLTLPIEIQDALLHGEISERHARSLLSMKDTRKQLDLLDKIKNEKLTVRELDGVIKSMLEEPNKDGLYDLPGSDEYNERNKNNNIEMDFSRYEQPAQEEKPQEQASQEDNQFLNFLNNIGDKDVATTIENTIEENGEKQEEKPQENNEFLSFLNNFDSSTIAPVEAKVEEPKEELPVVEEKPQEGTQENNEFLSFLNNFESSTIAPVEAKPIEEPKQEGKPEDNEFMSFLNNFNSSEISSSLPEVPTTSEETSVVEEPKQEETSQDNKSFSDFLNSFNSSVEEPKEELPVVEEPKQEEKTENNEFLSFLNNMDDTNVQETLPPVTENAEPKEETTTPLESGAGLQDFLQKYEAPVDTPVDLGPVSGITEKEPEIEEPYDPKSKYLNPIEEVAPKTEYVENGPNYVDITKPISYDSIDSIIKELKVVTDKIKKSKYKITTEETNFDDIYTITIKIDKRNFL